MKCTSSVSRNKNPQTRTRPLNHSYDHEEFLTLISPLWGTTDLLERNAATRGERVMDKNFKTANMHVTPDYEILEACTPSKDKDASLFVVSLLFLISI